MDVTDHGEAYSLRVTPKGTGPNRATYNRNKQPTATKPPANTSRGGQTPHQEGIKDRTPKEAQGDQPAKTGNTKPGTAAHREKGRRETCRHTPCWKKKEPASKPERKGMGGQGPRGPGQGQPATDTTKPSQDKPKNKKEREKHTPTTQPRRAGHSRDPGPARTPTHRTPARKDGEQAGRAHNHAPLHDNPNQEVQETTRDGRTSTHTPQHPPQGEAERSQNPNPSTHAHTAHRNGKRRGAGGARTQPHTSHMQAET